ncbi:MAG: D-alanyl-D-alanine carboxypeptidase, partial [Gammaproteobacteria bacterium]
VRTLSAHKRPQVTVERKTVHGSDSLHVAGGIPLGSPARRYYVAASHPARMTGEMLRVLLARSGVRVDGRVRVVSLPVLSVKPLASIQGFTLGHEIAMMLHYSNNYMADTLALDLAVDRPAADKAPTLTAAGRRLGRFAARINRDAGTRLKTPAAAPTIESGSGLTPENRLSASDIVALLSHVYRDTAVFPAYLAGLSVPGSAPLRMLRGGGAAWMQRVAVKTGSMNEPVSVLNVAGYYRTPSGGWGAFAVLVNGTARHPHFPWWTAMHAIEQDVGRLSGKGAGDR